MIRMKYDYAETILFYKKQELESCLRNYNGIDDKPKLWRLQIAELQSAIEVLKKKGEKE